MAISKSIEAPSGVDATYHRISMCVHDFRGASTRVMVESFASEDARRSGKTPLHSEELTVHHEQGVEPTRAWAYSKLVQEPQYATHEVAVIKVDELGQEVKDANGKTVVEKRIQRLPIPGLVTKFAGGEKV